MSVNEKGRHVWRWAAGCCLLLIAGWYMALPRVVILYSKDGSKDISYVLNTQHSILRRDLVPGATTGDVGHIFPDKDFFMMFDWWAEKSAPRCISIKPRRWHTLEIHLDRFGRIDTAITSPNVLSRLKVCPDQGDPFRP